MNKLSIPGAFGLLLVALLFMFSTAPAEAFEQHMVDRSSYSFSDQGIGVFELTIMIGGWSKDLYLPVVGERSLPFASRENRFGFELESGHPNEVSDAGDVTALMIAPFEIVDGYYKIPARTLASVKILAITHIDEADSNTYRFRVTELPFLEGADMTPGHFSSGEMKYLFTNHEPFHYEYDPE